MSYNQSASSTPTDPVRPAARIGAMDRSDRERHRRSRGAPHRRVRMVTEVGAAALGILALVALSVPVPVEAQSTLVSNTGRLTIGTLTLRRAERRAQLFTTGTRSGGYELSSVQLPYSDLDGDPFSLSVCTVNARGLPSSTCTELTAPARFPAIILTSTTLTFTVPSNTTYTLTPNTTYAVLFTIPTNFVRLFATHHDREDSGANPGWSIANHSLLHRNETWLAPPNDWSLRIAIKGTGVGSGNHLPTVENPLPDRLARVGAAFRYAFPADTFADANNRNLTYTATQGDGTALPSWLTFTPATRLFTGTPATTDAGVLTVKVTASDGTESISDTFDILVAITDVCSRTPGVRDGIVAAVAGVSHCTRLTSAHLAGITGTLNVSGRRVSRLKPGDFAGMPSVRVLNLNRNNLASLPDGIFDELVALTVLRLGSNDLSSLGAGIFDEHTALTELYLDSNDLASLPGGIFDELTALTKLYLDANDLASLPDGIFDKLTALTDLRLDSNPGAPFRPTANAGANRLAVSGLSTTLAGTATGPWGDNVTWEWTQVDGASSNTPATDPVTLTGADTASPSFTAPDAPLHFRLIVVPKPGADPSRGRAASAADWITTSNTGPRVANGIPDRTAVTGFAFSYAFPENTFDHTDGDTLVYTATRSDDTALPSWLTFNAATRTFSGTPTGVGTVPVKVIATDTDAITASDPFDITVSRHQVLVSAREFRIVEGESETYTVALNHAPRGTVTLALSVTGTPEVTVDPTVVTFDATTWDMARTVTINAADDADHDIDRARISHQISARHDKVTAPDVEVTVADPAVGRERFTVDLVVTSGATARPRPPTTELDTKYDHEGRGQPIEMKIRFSEEPEAGLSHRHLMDHLVKVTALGSHGADVEVAAQPTSLDPPSNREWKLTITPRGYSDFRVSVLSDNSGDCSDPRMLCTGDGRALSRSNLDSFRFHGPENIITISDVAVTEPRMVCRVERERHDLEDPRGSHVTFSRITPNSPCRTGTRETSIAGLTRKIITTIAPGMKAVKFLVSYHNPTKRTVVSYTTRDSTAKSADGDYMATSGSIPFPFETDSPTRGQYVSVIVLGDNENDEPEESFHVDLTTATNGATIDHSRGVGTIRIPYNPSDPFGSTELQVEVPTEPLTAEFADVPLAHDGRNSFTFELLFSAEPELDAEDVPDVLTVIGGAVTGARRLDEGSARRWEVTIKPSSNTDVSIFLGPTEDCEAEGAVCTADGRMLEVGFGVPVSGPDARGRSILQDAGLTGAFLDVPPSHDGNSFTVELALSQNIDGLSFRTIRNHALDVTGGAVMNVRRLDPPRNQRWEVRVEPDGNREITISLPETTDCSATGALCTAGGEMLSRAASVTVPGRLTAAFRDVPESHDGSSAFIFELALSEDIEDLSPVTVSDSVLDVTGGEVTKATLLDPPGNEQWEVTVKPDGDGEVTITLPATTDCDATGALCTAHGVMLSPALSVTVPGAEVQVEPDSPPDFTVSFEGLPASHDGRSRFSFKLLFSEEPVANYRFRTLRDKTLRVSQGRLKLTKRGVKRLTQGSNQSWEVTLVPISREDIRVAIGPTADCADEDAVCTADGRKLSNEIVATVSGSPGLSVADAQIKEAANAVLEFAVTLNRAAADEVTVDWATSDGTATAGSDYTAGSGTLTFDAGETAKTVSVAVLDDAVDEGEETMTLTLSNASGGDAWLADATATGTIENDDPMPHAWLSRLGRTVAGQAVDAIGARMEGAGGSHITVGGMRLDGNGKIVEPEEDGLVGDFESLRWNPVDNTQSMTTREMLLGSSFRLGAGGENGAPSWAGWGHFVTGGFEADVDGTRMDADVTTGFLGADVGRDRWLAGIAVSFTEADGDYELLEGDDKGTVESSLTTLYPYAKMGVTDKVDVWGMAGLGHGELTLTQHPGTDAEQTYKPDIDMKMGVLGVRGQVLSPSESGGLSLAVKSDAFWVETESDAVRGSRNGNLAAARADASRVRLIVEGSRAFDTGNGTLTPSAEVGVRYDGGDAETGTGVEVGGGLRFERPGVSIEGRVRTLVAHEESGYEEWGASGSVRIQPSDSGRGLSFTLSPAWGAASSGVERLWGLRDARGLENGGDFEAESRLDAEIGIGVGVPHSRGLVTPFAGLSVAEGGNRTWRTGTRWKVAPEATLGLEATRQEQRSSGTAENAFLLRGEVRW